MDNNNEQHGPRRKAPEFYAGERCGRHQIHYPDVERYPNGVLPGKRDKFMRRVIRGALKRRHSKFERNVKLPRAMLAQAREVADDQRTKTGAKLSRSARSRWARRLFERELAIHQPRPNEPTRAQRREYARQLKKAGKKDAIAQLVDAMAEGKLKP